MQLWSFSPFTTNPALSRLYDAVHVMLIKKIRSVPQVIQPQCTGILQDSRGREFKVILLDSEGINAVTEKDKNDHQIFTLTVLLASILIYNSRGVPKRTDLDDLGYPL